MFRIPPGWPSDVPLPSADDWLVRASSWLLDQLPGEYREFEVARRHPVLLARLALLQVRAETNAVRLLVAKVRVDMKEMLTPEATASAVEMLEKRLVTLASLERQVTLVGEAIEGSVHRPRV
jgi:hypothetical protein